MITRKLSSHINTHTPRPATHLMTAWHWPFVLNNCHATTVSLVLIAQASYSAKTQTDRHPHAVTDAIDDPAHTSIGYWGPGCFTATANQPRQQSMCNYYYCVL